MTGRRVAALLIAALLIVVLAIWLASRGPAERPAGAGQRVLPGLAAAVNSVTAIQLAKGDGTRTDLKKGANDWTVTERGYPADSGKVRKLLLDLGSLDVVEEKTRDKQNYPQLGVEDISSSAATGTRVEALTPAKTYALIVGKSSSGKAGYVRAADSPQSVLATPLLTLDADPRRWLDTTLLDIPQERIKEISVQPAEGPPYTASREKKEQPDFTVAPLPKGRELSSPAAADPIAGSLGSLTLDDVQRTDAAQGATTKTPPTSAASPKTAAAPSRPVRATFRTFDGLELQINGRKEGAKTFIALTARSSGKETEAEAKTLAARLQGWEYEIPSYKFDGMFRPLEELLKKPPEPVKKDAKGAKGNGKASAHATEKSAPQAIAAPAR